MNVDFVPYQEALELKELGFDEPCFGRFYSKPKCKMFSVDEKGRHYQIKNTPKKLYTVGEYFVLNDDNAITAPTFSQAFRWFREKYQLQGYIYSTTVRGTKDSDMKFSDYCWHINGIDMPFLSTDARDMEKVTYEEAELACLRKLIEIIKSQKE